MGNLNILTFNFEKKVEKRERRVGRGGGDDYDSNVGCGWRAHTSEISYIDNESGLEQQWHQAHGEPKRNRTKRQKEALRTVQNRTCKSAIFLCRQTAQRQGQATLAQA